MQDLSDTLIEGKNIVLTVITNKCPINLLNNCSFSVKPSTIYGLIGPSGSGKTTLMKCIIGYSRINSGYLRINGKNIVGHTKVCGKNIGYMPQDISLAKHLTIEEMLTYFGKLSFLDNNTIISRIDHLLNLLDINNYKKKIIKDLSGGQMRRVSFACSLIHEPRLILLDEPTAGCDPILRAQVWNYLKKLRDTEKATIIVTTHYIEEVSESDCIGFMRRGSILLENSPKIILKSYMVKTLEDALLKVCLDNIKDEFTESLPSSSLMYKAPLKTYHDKASTGFKQVSNNYKINKLKLISSLKMASKEYSSDLSDTLNKYLKILTTVLWRILLFTRKEIIKLLLMITILAFVQGFLFGSTFGKVPFDLSVGFIDFDKTNISNLFSDHIPNIIKLKYYNDISEARKATLDYKLFGYIIINKGFSQNILSRLYYRDEDITNYSDTSKIHYIGDSANAFIKSTLEIALNKAVKNFVDKLVDVYNISNNPYKILEKKDIYTGDDDQDYWGNRIFIIPSLLAFIPYTLSYLVSLMILFEEKKYKLFEREYALGVKESHILFGYVINNILVATTYIQIVLFAILYMLNSPFNGSYILIILLSVSLSIVGNFHGILLSYFCGEPLLTHFIATGFMIAGNIISGLIWQIDAYPYFMKHLRYIFPYSLALNAARMILVRNKSLDHMIVRGAFTLILIHLIIIYVILYLKLKKGK